jgi:hypothetical protein
VALAALALLTLTQRGVHGGQYVLPLYSVLPCWIGDTLRRLWRRRRALCVGALGAFVWVQGVATWTTIVRAEPEKLARWAPVQQRVAPLRAWLDARGIDRLYWAPPGSFEFSYLTGLRLVAAHPWAEIASPLSHLVDAAATPPILVDPKDAGSVADGLRAIGMEPRATPIGAFVVFRPEPVVPMGFAPLSPEGWTVTSSHQPDMTRFLVDRDATTGWGTDQPQAPGQWLAVDLGSIQEVARIDLLTFSSREAPAGFRVEASRDGASWVTVVSVPRYWHPVFFSERHPFFKLQRARVQAIFRPVHARFIRITQTGSSPRHEWAAREIFVYRPTPPPREVAGPEIVAALRREHVTFVHSNPWLSAVVRTESGWRIGSTEWNAVVNSYGRPGPPGGYTVFRAEAGHAILAGSDADLDGIREMLTSRWAPVRESDVGPYRLMVLPPPSARRRWMSSKGWGATASENDAESRLGIDGHTPTRWVSRSPMGPGLTFAVDLRTVRRVAAVELKPALADVGLEGSRDGAAWFPIEPVHWAGPILWTGWELLRAETHAWAVTFSPVDLRYLRVRPLRITGSPWAIQELRIFD